MAIVANMLATAPTGLWEKIIFAFNGAVKNYALAIILLTLCIKLIMLPLDYVNRRSSAKMTEVQEKLQPKMAEIQRKYPDKTIQNQKMGELYQKEGFNPMGSCLPMLAVMVLSMVVFFTLFGGLNRMAAYKITDQYEKLQMAYITDYCKTEKTLTDEQLSALTSAEVEGYILEIKDSGNETVIAVANANVEEKYKEVQERFLWIKNVWIADSPLAKAIPTFDAYAKTAGLKFEGEDAEVKKTQAETAYNTVMGNLEKTQGVNGYFILAILAGVSTFLSQYLLTKKKKQRENYYSQQAKESDAQKAQQSSSKMMMIIFPVIMLIFTLSYNSIFAIYIVTSQLFSTATAPLINKILDLRKNKKAVAGNNNKVVDITDDKKSKKK